MTANREPGGGSGCSGTSAKGCDFFGEAIEPFDQLPVTFV
jgi:hypothetical protein